MKAPDPDHEARQLDEARAPTVLASGKRRWIYPDRRPGRLSRIRGRLALVLIMIYSVTPWLSIDGRPVLRFDITSDVIYFFGAVLQFDDAANLVFLVLIAALTLGFCTSLWGRLWCGYTCPQTVFVEWVVRPVEELLEGKASRRQVEDGQPLTVKKAFRKVLKHGIYAFIAANLANSLLAYFVEPRVLISWMLSSPLEHPLPFLGMSMVMVAMYIDLAWFREQFCSFLCPYARFQAVMMDEHTPTITYDGQRGDPRGKRGSGLGDCIDCAHCVRVCPTGIDIRDGLQLECIQCGRCADACDQIMDNLKRPRGLISTASVAGTTAQGWRKVRFRPILYGVLLVAFAGVAVYRVVSRADMEAVFIRQPGAAFSRLPDGAVANLFQVRLKNTTGSPRPMTMTSLTPGVELICGPCDSEQIPAWGERRVAVILVLRGEGSGNLQTARIRVEAGPTRHEVPLIQPGPNGR